MLHLPSALTVCIIEHILDAECTYSQLIPAPAPSSVAAAMPAAPSIIPLSQLTALPLNAPQQTHSPNTSGLSVAELLVFISASWCCK
jgi:hypothetical protein